MRRNRMRGGRSVSSAASVVEKAILPGSAHQQMIAKTWMNSGQPSSDADSDLFGLDWGDDPTTTINSVTERNDEIRGGTELLAFVDSCAFDKVLTKSVCTAYLLEASWFKGAKRVPYQALRAETLSSRDKRWKQYEHHFGKSRTCASR